MKRMILISYGLMVAGVCLATADNNHGEAKAQPVRKAVAVMYPTQGYSVQGVVTFTKVEKGIRVEARLRGLTPGKHGFHVHEYGDCSSTNAMSAGGHFAGGGTKHGAPDSKDRHAGDFGNIDADENGVGRYDRVDTMIALDGPNSIIGRSLIVHDLPDDLITQPTGAAGGRVACGVIGVAKE
jgi:Cu-Zn family superoxide dismutase